MSKAFNPSTSNPATSQLPAQLQRLQNDYADMVLWVLLGYSATAFAQCVQGFAAARDFLQHWQANNKPNVKANNSVRLHANHVKRLQRWHTAVNSNVVAPDDIEINELLYTLDLIDKQQCAVISQSSAYYPATLKNIADPPAVLWVRGVLDNLLLPQVGIVGSRKPTPSGVAVTTMFASQLATAGMCITSGFAQGVDAAAHKGALQAAGRTIAVLGTGVMQCYPASHYALYEQMLAAQCTLVSEFMPNTPPVQHNFPRRNRIISGLSLGLLVTEAAVKSGSLITAQLAADQGRQVFAVPGHIENPMAKGCHDLIREGVTLVDHPDQVLEDLNIPIGVVANIPLPTDQQLPLDDLMGLLAQIDWSGASVDALVAKTNLPVHEVLQHLTLLELDGRLLCKGGLYYRTRINQQ